MEYSLGVYAYAYLQWLWLAFMTFMAHMNRGQGHTKTGFCMFFNVIKGIQLSLGGSFQSYVTIYHFQWFSMLQNSRPYYHLSYFKTNWSLPFLIQCLSHTNACINVYKNDLTAIKEVSNVLHQRWFWRIHCTLHTGKESTQARGSTLALKSRVDITRSPKQGYQWPHKKDWYAPKKFLKIIPVML